MPKCVQYELSFRTENVLRMKMGNFKKSCLKKYHKILKLANFENGGYQYSVGHPACYVKNLPTSSLLLVNNRSAKYEM